MAIPDGYSQTLLGSVLPGVDRTLSGLGGLDPNHSRKKLVGEQIINDAMRDAVQQAKQRLSGSNLDQSERSSVMEEVGGGLASHIRGKLSGGNWKDSTGGLDGISTQAANELKHNL